MQLPKFIVEILLNSISIQLCEFCFMLSAHKWWNIPEHIKRPEVKQKNKKKGLNFIKQHKNGVIEKVIRWNAA